MKIRKAGIVPGLLEIKYIIDKISRTGDKNKLYVLYADLMRNLAKALGKSVDKGSAIGNKLKRMSDELDYMPRIPKPLSFVAAIKTTRKNIDAMEGNLNLLWNGLHTFRIDLGKFALKNMNKERMIKKWLDKTWDLINAVKNLRIKLKGVEKGKGIKSASYSRENIMALNLYRRLENEYKRGEIDKQYVEE